MIAAQIAAMLEKIPELPEEDVIDIHNLLPNKVMPAADILKLLSNVEWDPIIKSSELRRKTTVQCTALQKLPPIPFAGYVAGL